MDNIEIIKKLIKEGELDQALLFLTNCMAAAPATPGADKSELYYLCGNVYRKKGEFHMAMGYYMQAIEENPNSPAVEARKALQGIIDFYNKDMYNH